MLARKVTVSMIPEKLVEILKNDGVAAIATLGADGPHLVNTWNSYINISVDGRLLIPAGYMNLTEANVAFNNKVLITLNSRKVTGNHGPGAGFLIKGTAAFLASGPDYDLMKSRFSWMRATLAVTVESAIQTW
jgi:predicted pyridoxine 5'-phosphate oxidase superfamily flavin-nucleotide-binding protein